MTALLMDGPEPIGPALCHHSERDPPRMSAPVQAHYGIYRNPVPIGKLATLLGGTWDESYFVKKSDDA